MSASCSVLVLRQIRRVLANCLCAVLAFTKCICSAQHWTCSLILRTSVLLVHVFLTRWRLQKWQGYLAALLLSWA